MSMQAVSRLLAAAKDDPELRQELESATEVEGLARVAADHGFDVTAEELRAVLSQLQGEPASELGDDELAKVAGGVGMLAPIGYELKASLVGIKWNSTLTGGLFRGYKVFPKVE